MVVFFDRGSYIPDRANSLIEGDFLDIAVSLIKSNFLDIGIFLDKDKG